MITDKRSRAPFGTGGWWDPADGSGPEGAADNRVRSPQQPQYQGEVLRRPLLDGQSNCSGNAILCLPTLIITFGVNHLFQSTYLHIL